MFDRIPMKIVQMPAIIRIVTYLMLPETPLPQIPFMARAAG
jgi:hypothetical protein